jgi:D-cysteine desulfhydrase
MHFADLPTPVHEAPRLAEAIGVQRLFIKRDDNTGLAMGGNKARKLEYSIAEARDAGADVVLTCGGPQSNHVRMTAAAARKAGMDSILFMPRAEKPETFGGNLLLDTVLGAEMRFLPDMPFSSLDQEMAQEASKLIEAGRVPYVLPMGGSTPLADLGYVNAMLELSEQLQVLDAMDADIFVAVGTGGTLAGIAVGGSVFLPHSRLFGISVVLGTDQMLPTVTKHANETAKLIGIDEPDLSGMSIRDGYIGKAYGVPTDGGKEAILLTARTEGIILDPVYTGKAMAGLIDLARKGEIGKDRPVVFWHTGGGPGLFDYESLFHDEAVRLARG